MPVGRPRKNTNKDGLDTENLEPTKCPFCKGEDMYRRTGGPQGLYKNVWYINYHCNNPKCGRWFSGWLLKWFPKTVIGW